MYSCINIKLLQIEGVAMIDNYGLPDFNKPQEEYRGQKYNEVPEQSRRSAYSYRNNQQVDKIENYHVVKLGNDLVYYHSLTDLASIGKYK